MCHECIYTYIQTRTMLLKSKASTVTKTTLRRLGNVSSEMNGYVQSERTAEEEKDRIRDVRAKLYWIYKPRNPTEIKV